MRATTTKMNQKTIDFIFISIWILCCLSISWFAYSVKGQNFWGNLEICEYDPGYVK